jgi:hypothetical protein
MRAKLPLLAVLTATSVVGWSSPAYANALINGDFEATWDSGTVAPSWSGINGGASWLWAKDTVNYRGTQAQKVYKTTSNTANWGAVYQNVSANVGDAFTLADAWVYCVNDSTKVAATVRASLNGTTTALGNAPIWATAAQDAGTWYEFTTHPGGNATATMVTFGVVTRMAAGNAASTDLSATWDDLVIYQAYVPPAPSVFDATEHTLTVDVNPGSNLGNLSAEYAISLGSNWVQADGTVGADPVWLTDLDWGSKVVTGLVANTTYDFEVLARYDSAYPQATLPQGFTGSLTTIPEPTTLTLLLLGSVALLRRRS